jgi:hypothetical protein
MATTASGCKDALIIHDVGWSVSFGKNKGEQASTSNDYVRRTNSSLTHVGHAPGLNPRRALDSSGQPSVMDRFDFRLMIDDD